MLRPRSGPRPRRDAGPLGTLVGVKRLRRDPRKKGVGGRGLRPRVIIKLVCVVRQAPNLCPAASNPCLLFRVRKVERRQALLSSCSHRVLRLCGGAERPEPERSSGPDSRGRRHGVSKGWDQQDTAGL